MALGRKEIYKAATALARETGVKWSQNVLHHSFISYWLAVVPDAPRVTLGMGTSPEVIFKHYRQLATPARAVWSRSSDFLTTDVTLGLDVAGSDVATCPGRTGKLSRPSTP